MAWVQREKTVVFSCTEKKRKRKKGGNATFVFLLLFAHPGHVRIYITTTPIHKFTLTHSHSRLAFTAFHYSHKKLALESVSSQS